MMLTVSGIGIGEPTDPSPLLLPQPQSQEYGGASM